MNTNKLFFTGILLSIIFMGCHDTANNQEDEHINTLQNNKVLISVKEIFESFPTPVETAKTISETGVKFNQSILNPVSNVPYYETSKSLALNLGIYCADLSYASYYEQNQLVSSYLSAIKTLSENLGILQIIDNQDIIKIEDQITNQDSLRQLIKELFLSSGKYLNEDNRPEMAVLVQTGAWIEGMYIAMQLATQSIEINKELVDKIARQKASLDMVVNALRNYSDYAVVIDIYNDMLRLQKIYHKTDITEKDSSKAHLNNLHKNQNVYITPEIFISIFKEITRIRNSYTQ